MGASPACLKQVSESVQPGLVSTLRAQQVHPSPPPESTHQAQSTWSLARSSLGGCVVLHMRPAIGVKTGGGEDGGSDPSGVVAYTCPSVPLARVPGPWSGLQL